MTFGSNPKHIAIIEDDSGESEPKKDSIVSTSDNLADVVTRKPPKIMKQCNDKEVLQQAKGSTNDQSVNGDHHMSVSYKEYNKKLDEEKT